MWNKTFPFILMWCAHSFLLVNVLPLTKHFVFLWTTVLGQSHFMPVFVFPFKLDAVNSATPQFLKKSKNKHKTSNLTCSVWPDYILGSNKRFVVVQLFHIASKNKQALLPGEVLQGGFLTKALEGRLPDYSFSGLKRSNGSSSIPIKLI